MTEIALQFVTEQNSDIEFTEFLLTFECIFNNSTNVTTEHSSNEIIYRFWLNDSFKVMTESEAQAFEEEC